MIGYDKREHPGLRNVPTGCRLKAGRVNSYLSEALELARDQTLFTGHRKAVFLGSAFSSVAHCSLEHIAKENCFDGIPTMVTVRELRLLTNLFSTVHVGGSVLEIGSYLGGSTGAIARGLEAAGRTRARNRFYVLDSFAWADPSFVTHLAKDIERLQQTYKLSDEAIEATKKGDWLQTFHEVHCTKTYYHRLQIRKATIPYTEAAPFQLHQYVPRL